MVDVGAAPIDRYVVLEHLSEGGMGAIYVGKKLGAGGFEMEVVLKQLLPEFTQQEEFIDLFLREAKLASRLRRFLGASHRRPQGRASRSSPS